MFLPAARSRPTGPTPAPSTPAPPQPNAKSAPGAQSPNGANGVNIEGKPVTKSPNTPEEKAAPQSTASKSAPKPAGSIFDHYLKDLNDALKFTPDQQKEVQAYYLDDGAQMKDILNNDTLSPLQQTGQVDDLRDKRNVKIEALLEDDLEKRQEFFRIEAEYRVALVEFAANGGLVPARPVAPSPNTAAPLPGQAEPVRP